MSSKDVAVSVRDLSKSYTIAHNQPQHTTMAEAVLHTLRNPMQKAEKETFWALRDVNFDIQKGDVVGIVGRNGAGKSTLLKVLSRITEPTQGRAILNGRVGSLLEVGTGFHQELTGRENIFLNGAILGMTKREIAKQFDAIVDFSGVEQFLDTPVKRYSSGMYVRLAFAVAAYLTTEILIVDEVLAVGDTQFQKKCLGKMQDVSRQDGRTVLFVSHNMQSVSVLCDKAIFMEKGKITFVGDVDGAVERYIKSFTSQSDSVQDADRRAGTGEYRFTSVQPSKTIFSCDEEKCIDYRFERRRGGMGLMYLSAHVVNEKDLVVAQFDSRLTGFWLEDRDIIEGSLKFSSPWLKPGTYRIDIGICSHNCQADIYEGACALEISPVLPYPHTVASNATAYGLVLGQFEWSAREAGILSAV